MKKFTLFLSALLISAMSFAADITITSAETVTQDGVTIVFDKASGSNAPAWYAAGLRLYAKNTVTISAETEITNITFNWEKQGSKQFAGLTANVGTYTHPESTGEAVWTGSAKEVVFTVGDKGQLQLNTLSVTVGAGQDDGNDPEPEEPETPTDPEEPETPTLPEGVITCVEAVAICQETGETATTETYTIRGYVTNIASAYNAGYNNTSFWMADTKDGGKVFEAFRSTPLAEADKAVKVGDYVEVTGNLVNYKGNTPETAQGGTYTILEAAEGGTTPEDPETPTDPEEPEQPEGVLTCAEAVAICEQVGSTATTEEYTVRGYVTSIKYSWSEQYGTATFWIADTKDGGDVLQAYSCAPLTDNDKVFAVGAYVELVGKLKKYNTTNEVEKGTYTIITPADNPVDPEQPETPDVETVGNGTEENPFTVEDVIALNNTLSGKHYVKAYIVGHAIGQSFVDGLDTEAPFEAADGATQGTNIAIASSMSAEVANMIPVQLPKGELRNTFNLVEHPEMLGAEVLIYGSLEAYFKLPGIKSPTSIEVLSNSATSIDNVVLNQNITKFFENGQLIIIKDGVKFNAQGQVVK